MPWILWTLNKILAIIYWTQVNKDCAQWYKMKKRSTIVVLGDLPKFNPNK